MDPHDVWDLRRGVLKHQRACALDNKDSNSSIDAPRTEVSRVTSVSRMFLRVRYLLKNEFRLSFRQ